MKKTSLLAVLAALSLAAPAGAADRADPAAKLQKLVAGRVAGQSTNCISLPRSQSSQIIDGQAIVYRVGSTIYVNQPRSGAELLDDDDVLVTRTTSNQLCSVDVVTLVDRTTGMFHGSVILGEFVPYKKAEDRPSR